MSDPVDILDRTPRVLAIDDCPLVHGLLQHHLRREGVELHLASTAAEGLELAKRLDPDVVLLDIELGPLGVSDGFAVLSELKRSPSTAETVVIFLSASGATGDRVRALDLGAIDFVSKPFEAAELCARVRSAVRLRGMVRMLAQKASIDGLTGLWNRAHFDRRLAEECSESRRYGRSISLVLADIDHFKRINDEHGHPVGDAVIGRFAKILATGRASDIPCRYGGEEFALILPGVSASAALEVAERIRRRLAEERWACRDGLRVTASFGIADLDAIEATSPGEPIVASLVSSADEALYRAKAAGRDRVYCLAAPQSLRRTG
jgi:two-component system, cell cycle response regulator